MLCRHIVVVETDGFYDKTGQLISRVGLVPFEPPTFCCGSAASVATALLHGWGESLPVN